MPKRIRDYANIINRYGNLLSQARGLRPQEELPYSLMGNHLEQLGRQLGRACGTVRAPLLRSLFPSREEGRPQRREQNAAGDWVPLGEIERAEWVRLEREQRAAQDEEKRLRHQEALANARFERPAPEPTHPAERIAQMVEGVLRHR